MSKKVSYLERIKANPDQVLSEEQSYQASQNKLQLESDQLATQQALSSKRRELNQLLKAGTLSTVDIIACKDAIESLEKGSKAVKELIDELFPAE
jgi:hypothetical protein